MKIDFKYSWESQPLFATTMSELQSNCQDLRSLSISHPVDIEKLRGTAVEYENFDFGDGLFDLRPLSETHDFSPFTNLTELELHEIHGDIGKARRDIVIILTASPDLKTLSLSLNADAIIRSEQQIQNIEEAEYYMDFLKTLISEYVAARRQPRCLRKLVLGLSVFLWEEPAMQPTKYLGGLTDMSKPEELYVSNSKESTRASTLAPLIM